MNKLCGRDGHHDDNSKTLTTTTLSSLANSTGGNPSIGLTMLA